MRNIKLLIQYDGAAFHGFQQQPNGDTVEARLKAAIHRITGESVTVYGCSRTDAGVHANAFCCNFKTGSDRPCELLQRGLNAVLPPQIAVLSCEEAAVGFHARYDCLGKEYVYQIWNGKTRNPFLLDRALFYPFELDTGFLHQQAQAFVGTHDFASFCASGTGVKTTERTVYSCCVERQGNLVTFKVCGNGFLYNMVRIMVGTLLDMQRGKIAKDTIPGIIHERTREAAGITAPPQGLFLNRVFYEKGDWQYGGN